MIVRIFMVILDIVWLISFLTEVAYTCMLQWIFKYSREALLLYKFNININSVQLYYNYIDYDINYFGWLLFTLLLNYFIIFI